MQELGCKCMNLEVVTRKHRSKGNVVNTVLRRRRCRPVIIFSQQSSDSEPSMPKVLDVKVQILDALPRAPMCDFHLYLPKRHPIRRFVGHTRSLETQTASLFSLHPLPCDVDLLEIHVCALTTQSTCLGLYTKQRVLNSVPPWNMDQNVLAGIQQIEPLTMNVLQVGIAGGSHTAGSCTHRWKRRVWRRPTWRIRRAGRRAGRREGRRERRRERRRVRRRVRRGVRRGEG